MTDPVHRSGTGTAIVLVHGLGSRWQVFTPILEHLAVHHEVVAVDLPGFGARAMVADVGPSVASYATWLDRWCRDAGLNRPHLVGSSFGGGVALELARRGRARSVTAFSPIGFQGGPGRVWARAHLRALHLAASTGGRALTAVVQHPVGRTVALSSMLGRPARADPVLVAADLEALAGSSAFDAVRREHTDFRVDASLAEAVRSQPITIAWGSRDRLLPAATQGRRARRRLPAAHHATLGGSGHLPFSDDPQGCAALVLATTARAEDRTDRRPSVVVIGAGLGGLAAAVACKQAGHDDLLVLEQAHEVGGVWRDNTYPGAACDVPSPFYSYSFAPNPDWPRRFSRQPDILAYVQQVARTHDLRRHVRLSTPVVAARFDDATGRWAVELGTGEVVHADVLVSALGQLSRPSLPDIRGRDRFAGPSFHTARWDHDVELAGRRVAVVGTGASAVQVVPAIADGSGHVEVFQRSAPWILPRPDRHYSARARRRFAARPATQLLGRLAGFSLVEVLSIAWVHAPPLRGVLRAASLVHQRLQTRAEPGLHRRVRPSTAIGCTRLLFSSDYLATLARPDVTLTTDAIREVVADGIVTEDGVLHEADVLVWATGFRATEFLAPLTVTGVDGRGLRGEAWADGAHAHFGLAVPGFPNLLVLYGPNTNTGGGSIIHFLETQARWVADHVRHVARVGHPIAVRHEVERASDARVQAALADSVWTRCTSWYRDASGRITTNWPWLGSTYRRTARFDADEHEPVPPVAGRSHQ